MTEYNNDEQPIDPKLIEKIKLMGPTPERDPLLAAQGRKKFLSQLEEITAVVPESRLAWLAGLFKSGESNGSTVGTKKPKFAFSTLVVLIVLFVMVFGGASATAYASQSALPGDALYPIKTSLEVTQISLANDAYVKAQLNLEFAQKRMNEITGLLAQGRSKDVEFASSEFEHYIQNAMEATQIVLASDPERGAELSKLVSQALLDYAVALKSILVDAPEVVRPSVEKAILISQDGAGDEIEIVGEVMSISDTELEISGEKYLITELTDIEDLIGVGDRVKVHVILTADGLMIASEIELSSVFEDGGELGGIDNQSGEFSSDDNENEDSNDNGNVNESDDNGNNNESDDNWNDNKADDNVNDNESEYKGNDNESDDKGNDIGSNENKNDNHSEDNHNDNESHDNGNDNEKDDD